MATSFWSLPMTSGGQDMPVGVDELGNTVFETVNGVRYSVKTQNPQQGSYARAAWDAISSDPLGTARNMLAGAWEGVSAPGRAAAGEPMTYGDVAGTAMDWGLMNAPGMAFGKYDPATVNMGKSGAAGDISGGIWQNGVAQGGSGRNMLLESFDDIAQLVRDTDGTIYVRWSRGPEFDMKPGARSRDYQSGATHAGLSAVPVSNDATRGGVDAMSVLADVSDYSYLRGGKYASDQRPHFYLGTEVGVDSDGAPSIIPSKYLGTVSDDIINFIDEPDIKNRALAKIEADRSERLMSHYQSSAPVDEFNLNFARNRFYNSIKKLAKFEEKFGPITWPSRK